jgi:hypothetical protein
VAPPRAAELMAAGKLQAFVGGAPQFGAAAPQGIAAVESLGAFVMVRVNPDSGLAGDETSACAAAAGIVREMAARDGGLIVHPYPVTPLHGDYLYHADRAEAARQRLLAAPAPPPDIKVRAEGALARSLVPPDRVAEDGARWDIGIETASASDIVVQSMTALNGWMGPRWVRAGWYGAYRLLAASVRDEPRRQQVDAAFDRLRSAAYEGAVERVELERELVRLLASDCRAMVAGYTLRRESINVSFSAGIENISFDALQGLSSPMFLRTVKLKDFPWNGWLQLGVDGEPGAAWNPVGGFTDPFGRFMWYAVGDPAAIPTPNDAGWTLNRISEVEASPRR